MLHHEMVQVGASWIIRNAALTLDADTLAHTLAHSLFYLPLCFLGQVTESEHCVMKVEVLQETNSTGHKFKLHRVMAKKKQTGLAT